MGNCHSMFSEDEILIYDRVLQNDRFLNSGFKKESLKAICKGTYAGMCNIYGKFLDQKVSLQTVNGGDVCFEMVCSVCFVVY